MSYFVTGATGFIGRYLVSNLLKRKGTIHVLVRKGSEKKFDAIATSMGWDRKRLVLVTGDLSKPKLGLAPAKVKALSGKVKHFFHLAAIYDLSADAASQQVANIDGTRHAIELAAAIKAGCFHHTSSIAAAGLYPGVFREDMFEEAEGLRDPYLRTKHESEGIVRKECKVPFRIYRPSMVIGHSKTGEMDKIDGPYYLFTLIKKMRQALPQWVPTLGIEGGRINVVPVDFVADAMDHIAHKRGLDGQCFHLVDPDPKRFGELMNTFCRAAHAPEMTMRLDARMLAVVPGAVRNAVTNLPPVKRFTAMLLRDLKLPPATLSFITYPTKFDTRVVERALKGSKITVPDLDSYAWRIWDYWERHLDPDLFVDRTLRGHVSGKVVLITGGSSGIGKATAIKVAEAGAKVVIVARGEEELFRTRDEILAAGGKCWAYTCDLTDLSSCDKLVATVLAEHKAVDVLVNNAGRSIRRSVELSYDRFHDYERTMQLNYFGAIRLAMNLIPAMQARGQGHVINVSTMGVQSAPARFSAYLGSKSALEGWTLAAQNELVHTGVEFTLMNYPLVRTPMIAPTAIYRYVPAMSEERAVDWLCEAIVTRPKRKVPAFGLASQVMYQVLPKTSELIVNTSFQLLRDKRR